MNRIRQRFLRTPDERGTSFVELAIVAPVLMLLVFAAFSLCGQLRGSQHASSLSRELASTAYRDCLADAAAAAATSVKFNAKTCMNASVTAFKAATSYMCPNAGYVITLYNYDSAKDAATQTWQSPTAGAVSKVQVSTFTGTDPYGTALMSSLRTLDRLIIAEVFYPEGDRIVYAATII